MVGRSHAQVRLLHKELTDNIQDGGFHLHKLKSSSEVIRKSLNLEIDNNDKETYAKHNVSQQNCHSKAFHVQWNPDNDLTPYDMSHIFQDKVQQRMKKRKILS